MSDSIATLHRKITGASDLHSVVRTMKALAASSIGDYERSVLALAAYDRMVSLGLGECFRQASCRCSALASLPGRTRVWAVGERVQARLKDAGLDVPVVYAVPGSVQAIAPLIAQIQIDSEASRAKSGMTQVHVFHNRPLTGSLYEPVSQRLLPLDATWQHSLAAVAWPGKTKAEVLDHGATTLRALIREYLFISLFRACAESLASENASRLAAMERADRNINDLLDDLHGNFHRLRQGSIDEELFDLTAGYEALAHS